MKLLQLVLALLIAGCATEPPPESRITTSPEGSTILIDGRELGRTPVTHIFNFDANSEKKLVVKKEGYFSESVTVTPQVLYAQNGQVHVKLTESPMWTATTTSPATNEWLSLIVNTSVANQDVWQRMVDAVTKRFPELEEFDFKSGYIKSVLKARRFQTPRGEFRIRSRFIAAVSSEKPLTYKIKVISEWTDKGVTWHPYNRVFIEDSLLVNELVDRFGIK